MTPETQTFFESTEENIITDKNGVTLDIDDIVFVSCIYAAAIRKKRKIKCNSSSFTVGKCLSNY